MGDGVESFGKVENYNVSLVVIVVEFTEVIYGNCQLGLAGEPRSKTVIEVGENFVLF